MVNALLVFADASIRFALEFLDFGFHLAFLGDNLGCYIVWWIRDFDAFVVLLECVYQSRNGDTGLVISPIDFRDRFGVRDDTVEHTKSFPENQFAWAKDSLPSQVFITLRLELIEIEAL